MKFLNDLNSVQIESVKSINGPVIIIAGAGSGKTRVLTYRIAYLLECGVPPNQILALTFTNKAAGEMKKRIMNLVGENAANLWMGTFHSMFARILRKEAHHLNYNRSFTIYDEYDSLSTIKKIMTRLNLPTQQYHPSAVRARIAKAKNQYLSPAKFLGSIQNLFDEKVALIYTEYQKTLKQNNAMDFDDLLVKPIELFENKKELLEKYRYKFKFILVDEFQDTNRAQYHIIRMLGNAQRNVAVVGDDSQSIYSFRGADIRNILDFQRDFPDCKLFRLEQNYRSTKSIISVADNLIKNNKERLEKNLWTDNPVGDSVTIIQCMDDLDEGNVVVRTIQQEITKRRLDLKDFAVLYRTNAQSRILEEAFIKSSMPYEIVGGVRFYERKEIKDIIAYLRLIVNPADEESCLRIINYPARGIGDVTIEYLSRHAKKNSISLFDALKEVEKIEELTERARNGLLQFKALIEKYQKLYSQLNINELVRTLIDELGILKTFKEEGTAESLNRWENVQELISAVSEFHQENPDATLETFLEEVSLISDIDTWQEERNAVTLMTLHAAKGLEFPVVFIIGLEEGLLPFYSSSIELEDLEEERRVFYVGITRAQKKLYLTYTSLRYRYGDVTYPSESRFLYELGKEYIERLDSRNSRSHNKRLNGVFKSTPVFKHLKKEVVFKEDKMPDYETESQEYFEIKQGTIVKHDIFGRGRVVEINGSGDNQKAVVKFDNYGTKNLILKYAKLRSA